MKVLDIKHKGGVKSILLDDSDYYRYRRQNIVIMQKSRTTSPSPVYRRDVIDGKYRYIPLHREIVGAGKGQYVTLEDDNGYNLQKSNIVINNYPPALNRVHIRKDPTSPTYSQYRGISKKARGKRVRYSVTFQRKRYSGFISEIEAAKWYDRLAKKTYGAQAVLNFPNGEVPSEEDIQEVADD